MKVRLKIFDRYPLIDLKKLPADFLRSRRRLANHKSEEKLGINDLIEFSRKDQERIKQGKQEDIRRSVTFNYKALHILNSNKLSEKEMDLY